MVRTTVLSQALVSLCQIWEGYKYSVRTLFWTKTSRTFQGLSRTHFAFFKDSIQCKKEIWVYVFFSSTTTWAILSWRSFILGTWESGLDKVSTEIQGLSSTDYNFQGLSRPWTFYFKFQGLSRTFKVRGNPEITLQLSEWIMESLQAVLTFESVDESFFGLQIKAKSTWQYFHIYTCSLAAKSEEKRLFSKAISHKAICFLTLYKMKLEKLVNFWLFGREEQRKELQRNRGRVQTGSLCLNFIVHECNHIVD